MTDRSKLEVLVGKYFIATFPHWDGRGKGVIDSAHYLERFDPGSDGLPEAFAVVAIDDMVRAGREDEEGGPRFIGCFSILPNSARNSARGWNCRKTRINLASCRCVATDRRGRPAKPRSRAAKRGI
jgi:hypothetical protein